MQYTSGRVSLTASETPCPSRNIISPISRNYGLIFTCQLQGSESGMTGCRDYINITVAFCCSRTLRYPKGTLYMQYNVLPGRDEAEHNANLCFFACKNQMVLLRYPTFHNGSSASQPYHPTQALYYYRILISGLSASSNIYPYNKQCWKQLKLSLLWLRAFYP